MHQWLSLNPITTYRLHDYGIKKNQIQALSRTMSVFKDFPGLENVEEKFRNFQELLRTRKSPVNCCPNQQCNVYFLQG